MTEESPAPPSRDRAASCGRAAPAAAQPPAVGAVRTLEDPFYPTPLVGLDVVGRGVYLRPYQPYMLNHLLFKRGDERSMLSKECEQTFTIPAGYEVNDSPPFPLNESLNQVLIEESWDRFEKQMNLDANVAVSSNAFSISASATYNSRLRSEQEAYYAVRSSFVPLWMVYIPDPNEAIPEVRDPDIPVPFSHRHRREYDEFFRRYGSHYVRGAWVGGKSSIVFTVNKASQLSKTEIQAGVKASFGAMGGGVDSKKDESREKLRRSSQCTVFGKGGNEVKLAAMSSLDENAYNQWLTTIPHNPQVIEPRRGGDWTLIRDRDKADAIQEAYSELVSFDRITATVEIDDKIVFIRGKKYTVYDRDAKETEVPRPISDILPGLAKVGFERIDEVLRGKYLVSPTGSRSTGSCSSSGRGATSGSISRR